jgi:MaoC like domain
MTSLVTYARAALPLVPGASLLPFVAGRGKEMPPLERRLDGVRVDPAQLADYDRVCGFTLRDELPATYLHVRAFPLHMELMTDGRFPFPAVGLVHLSNRIVVHRRLGASETFDLTVRATPIEPHPKGRTFSIVSTASVDGQVVWEDVSTMLRRGSGGATAANGGPEGGGAGASAPAAGEQVRVLPAQREESDAPPGRAAEWRLAGDLGRRYASVSGDRNPIHMHGLSARLLGFPQAIAHGMWTKARCLAALEGRLPDAYAVDVAFRKPIFLPGRVTFAAAGGDGRTDFVVRGAKRPEIIHLEGTVTP